jgi:hypothetical protein
MFTPPDGAPPADARPDDAIDGRTEPDADPTGGRVVDDSLIGVWRFADGADSLIRDTVRALRPGYAERPMDLSIESMAGWQWIPGGLQLDGPIQIRTPADAASRPHLTRDVSGAPSDPGTHAVTLELWVSPANDTQGSQGQTYASIFSVSPNPAYCNLRIVQAGTRYAAGVRTTGDARGADFPIASSSGIVRPGEPTHLVLVSDGTTRKLYVDGEGFDSPPPGRGAPANWTDYYRITLGNENDATLYPRPWAGQLWFAAVYDRALTEAEIRQNRDAGHDCTSC